MNFNYIAYNPRTYKLSEVFSLESLMEREGIEFAKTQILFTTEGLEIWRGTGRLDSKGNEIFENFIVRDRSGEFYLISWYKDGFRVKNGVGYQEVDEWEQFTIVGNKVENEDILKKISWRF